MTHVCKSAEPPIPGRPWSGRIARSFRRTLRDLFSEQYADAMDILDRAAGRKMAGELEPDWRSMFTGDKLKRWASDVYLDLEDGYSLGADHGVEDIQLELDAQSINVKFGVWDVEAPGARDSIQRAAMKLSHESNDVTKHQLDALLPRLRAALTEGTAKGEGYDWMAKEIQTLFGHADKYRSERIAVTETQRAIHEGLTNQYVESGVVEAKMWLLSGAPCDLCIAIAAEAEQGIALAQAFAKVGDNETYSMVYYPPAHPNCMCSVYPILIPIERMPGATRNESIGVQPSLAI